MTNLRMNKDLRNIEVLINNGFMGAGMNERIDTMQNAVKWTKNNRKTAFVKLMMLIK